MLWPECITGKVRRQVWRKSAICRHPPRSLDRAFHHQRQGQSAKPCTLTSPVCRSEAGDQVFLTYGAHCNLTLLGGPPPVTAASHHTGVGAKAFCNPEPVLQHVLTWLLGVLAPPSI